MEEILSSFSSFVAIVSGLAAAGALIYTAITFRNDSKTRQGQIASEIIDNLLTLEEQLVDIKTSKGKISQDEYELKAKTWISVFFNRLEWISFLIITNHLKDKQIIEYFTPMFEEIVKDMFYDNSLLSETEREKEKKYKYIKTLHRRIQKSTLL